ncbi:hypothetical protein HY29_02795 [Hyphomonas beringensis]|uniref:Acyltransferase 3 domain-containing protein n=1 Tax=Hyphomonas beringensis TaxID=1280946 RepID=A0A062U8E9_9PROT|nr:acyltransferase [Hyphomonas beringensis]KCZ54013.1 hypothetical protein HY29_02795 [Hyphomonas beringensis]
MAPNRFDFIRLGLASTVFVYHAIALSALMPWRGLERSFAEAAEIAIQGFFIVSGALVAGSLFRSASLADYAGKRIRRLYPAYAVVVLVPALVSLVLTGDVMGVGKYLAANLVFLNFLSPTLPGLFEGNRFTEVNGALWTLKIEVMFYLALPLIAVFLKAMGRWRWLGLLALYMVGEAWRMCVPVFLDHPLAPEVARQLPGQMAFFASGIALRYLWDNAKARPILYGGIGALLFAASELSPMLQPLRAVGLTGLIASVAFLPGPSLNAARYGDISYGVYITHFPILQGLVAVGVFAGAGLVGGFALSALLVVGASFMLWHVVERRALRPSSHYRKVAASNVQE